MNKEIIVNMHLLINTTIMIMAVIVGHIICVVLCVSSIKKYRKMHNNFIMAIGEDIIFIIILLLCSSLHMIFCTISSFYFFFYNINIDVCKADVCIFPIW